MSVAIPSGFDDDFARFSSKSSISGDVVKVSHDQLVAAHKSLTAALLQTIPHAHPHGYGAHQSGDHGEGSEVASDVAEKASYQSEARHHEDRTACTVLHVEKPSVSGLGAPNRFVLVLGGDWREGCAFIAVGDEVTLSRFDVLPAEYGASIPSVGQLSPSVMLVTPNFSTEITAVRKKKVVINSKNVGQLELLTFSDRERKSVATLKKSLGLDHNSNGVGVAATGSSGVGGVSKGALVLDTPAPTDRNTFARIHRYYDVIFGQRVEFNRRLDFVMRFIAQAADNSVLDVGCGTGLLAFSLRYSSIFPVLVDKSPRMGEIVAEKNRFVAEVEDVRGASKGQQLPFYNADVRNLSLRKVSQDGHEIYCDFSTVLCLSTLALLDSPDDVQRALHTLHLHTALGGTALISFPNKDSCLRQRFSQETRHYPIDKHQLCVGASVGLANGQLDVLLRTRVFEPATDTGMLQAFHNVSDDDDDDEEGAGLDEGESMARDGVPRLQTTYIGAALHRHGATKETSFADFTDSTTQLLMSGGLIDTMILTAGFDIDDVYGDEDGAPFDQNTSPMRVYVLRKRSAV